jgi:hypothetical protein
MVIPDPIPKYLMGTWEKIVVKHLERAEDDS